MLGRKLTKETRLKMSNSQKRIVAKGEHNFYKHGGFGTPEFRAWQHILTRCLNPNIPNYHRYGGRGISVCSRWKKSFTSFLKDVGNRPSNEYSIDRINNNRGYCKSNCRWATRIQQARNKETKNKYGCPGVLKCKNRFLSFIGVDKEKLYLGCFKTLEKAIRVRKEAERKYWK